MRIPNKFTDPKTAKTYEWELNHDTEDGFEKRRNVTHGANTGQTGLVRKQADDSPSVLKFSGRILTEAMLKEMWFWWQLCRSQTIVFRDFSGDEYEVLFTYFNPVRMRAVRNPRDPSNAPHHTWSYELEMEVVRIIAGPMSGVTV
jgi:hypothetical protein